MITFSLPTPGGELGNQLILTREEVIKMYYWIIANAVWRGIFRCSAKRMKWKKSIGPYFSHGEAMNILRRWSR